MSKQNYFAEDDDKLPLCVDDVDDGYERGIIKGAAEKLEKWPSHLFYVFTVGCVVIVGLIFIICVTTAIYLPVTIDYRETRIFESNALPNVYFLKHKNRKWSTEDFCYMESVAKENPELNVYVIDIERNRTGRKNANLIVSPQNKNDVENEIIEFLEKTLRSLELMTNSDMRKILSTEYPNFRNVEISIETFFNGSSLSKNIDNFDDETLEIAVKAYLLWNTPGIILRPNMYCALNDIRRVLCEKKETCVPDELATLDPESDLQATEVPCQAFMGYLIRKLSNISKEESSDRHYTLKDALQAFCGRMNNCPEVRILDLNTECPFDMHKCPTVYPRFKFN